VVRIGGLRGKIRDETCPSEPKRGTGTATDWDAAHGTSAKKHYNYWTPSFRPAAKEKQADGRCRKVCKKEPGTPYERLMESPDVSEESKAGLRRRRAGQNPVELNRSLNEAAGLLLKRNREKQYDEKTSCQGDGQASRSLISTRFLLLGNRLISTR
jgi:hypothetical protein